MQLLMQVTVANCMQCGLKSAIQTVDICAEADLSLQLIVIIYNVQNVVCSCLTD